MNILACKKIFLLSFVGTGSLVIKKYAVKKATDRQTDRQMDQPT